MIVNIDALDNADRVTVYANYVASHRLFHAALRKLAETDVPMREAALVRALTASKRVFKYNLGDYTDAFIKHCCWQLAKDDFLIKKRKYNRKFCVLGITEAGRNVLNLADQIIKV